MDKKILIINPGSASKKHAFYIGEKEILKAHFESEGSDFIVTKKSEKGEEKIKITEIQYKRDVELVIDFLIEEGIIFKKEDIDCVGFRTVAPGSYFLSTRKIDDEFMDQLSLASDRAPLHVASLIFEIKEISSILPNVSKFGVSDSSFFVDKYLPSRYYGLPLDVSKEYEMFRYGYHGISAQSAVKRILALVGGIPKRIVMCHLGSGVSVIAIKDSKGFDSSMGFTPLEGVVMSTRAGDVDAGALVYLMKRKGFSSDELNSFLNKKCGLLGLSGITGDMRELIRLEKEGNKEAKLAIEVFVYKIKKEIGASIASLGGIDALVFTATIGERSNIIRERVCVGLEDLGIKIDKKLNDETINKEGVISSENSPVKIAVVKIDEMSEIFEEVKSLI